MQNTAYVMITADKMRFLLSEQEYRSVVVAIAQNLKSIFIQQCTVSLAITPTVMPYEKWYAIENEKLFQSGKRLCRLCGSAMGMIGGCPCWHKNGDNEKNPYEVKKLPESLQKMLADMVKIKTFPALTEAEKEKVESENNEIEVRQRIAETNKMKNKGPDFWNDKNGDVMYS